MSSMRNLWRTWEYKGHLIVLPLEDIYYFSSEQRALYVHTKSKTYQIGGTLKAEAERMKEFSFVRTHNAYLVHLRYLESIGRQDAILRNGHKIPVSERRGQEVKMEMKHYLKRLKNSKDHHKSTKNGCICPKCLHWKNQCDILVL